MFPGVQLISMDNVQVSGMQLISMDNIHVSGMSSLAWIMSRFLGCS